MARHILIFVLLLSAVAAARAAAARDIFVSNANGDDRRSGSLEAPSGETGGPVRTIGKALRLARAGDRIVLEKTPEPYRESISLVGNAQSGGAAGPLTIEGRGAILDGTAPVPADAWKHFDRDVFTFTPPRMQFQQLYYEGKPLRRIALAQPPKLPELQPLEWCMHEGIIYFRVDGTHLPDDYCLRCASLETGITLYHVSDVAIVDLIVQGFHVDGISAFNSAGPVYLSGVIARGNGRAGISVGGASKVELQGSLVGSNGVAQLLSLPYSECRVTQTRLLGDTAPGWVDQGGAVFVDRKAVHAGLPSYEPAASAASPGPH